MADVDINGNIISGSDIKASDMNVKFQRLSNAIIDNEFASTLDFEGFSVFNAGEAISRIKLKTELEKVGIFSSTNIQFQVSNSISSADINGLFNQAKMIIDSFEAPLNQIAVSNTHTCAIKSSTNDAYCWG